MLMNAAMEARRLALGLANLDGCGIEPQPAPRAMVLGLLQRLARHHPDTHTHSVQVARLTVSMWNLSPDWFGPREGAMLGGLLHDIGKLSVPNELLGSQRHLSDAEFSVMAEHTGRGALLLRQMGFAEEVVSVAHDHHERWSGGGYPSGRPSAFASPLSRAVATADAFSAMIEPRSYCRAMTIDQGLAELTACRGAQFDPDMVDLLHASMGSWATQATSAPGMWLEDELN